MENTIWELIDDRGVIYSGFSEEETWHKFDNPNFEWEGDLKLVEVRAIKR